MVDYILMKFIISGIEEYAKKQRILHAAFMKNYADLVRLSNIDFLPRSGFIFDDDLNKWAFQKHGCGYEFSCNGAIVDINDYFILSGDIFDVYRLSWYFESIGFDFKNKDADEVINAALAHLESQGGIIKTYSNLYYKFT